METNVIFAVAIALVVLFYSLIRFSRAHRPGSERCTLFCTESFEGSVVADIIGYFLVRDDDGNLYALPKKDNPVAEVEDLVYVRCKGVEEINADILDKYECVCDFDIPSLELREYTIMPDKRAKRASVIRRLNKDYAFCQMDGTYMFVRCTADEQVMVQELTSHKGRKPVGGKVVEAINCENLLKIPVCETEEKVIFPICCVA